MRDLLRRLWPLQWPLVALLTLSLLLPLHSHLDADEEAPSAACAWVESGPRVVFGATHSDGHGHLCPLSHWSSAPSLSPLVTPVTAGSSWGNTPQVVPGVPLPGRVRNRGPPTTRRG